MMLLSSSTMPPSTTLTCILLCFYDMKNTCAVHYKGKVLTSTTVIVPLITSGTQSRVHSIYYLCLNKPLNV